MVDANVNAGPPNGRVARFAQHPLWDLLWKVAVPAACGLLWMMHAELTSLRAEFNSFNDAINSRIDGLERRVERNEDRLIAGP